MLNSLKTMPQDDDSHSPDRTDHSQDSASMSGLWARLKTVLKPKSNGDHLREALEDYIEEIESEDNPELKSIAEHEKALISNVLKLRDLTAEDVMIPRADIAAIDMEADKEGLLELLQERQFSRIPVYRETLDDVIGTIHIKDLMQAMISGKDFKLKGLVRDVPVVSPSMPVLDLLLMMRQTKKHMAMVVDEFGGIDGLVTIGDVIEDIVGEFEDEFDPEDTPRLHENKDGSITADARYDIEEFEELYGDILSEEEREDVDTLGGLVFYIANRVPARGEVIKHDSGMVFEILDADPRRVNTLRIRNVPDKAAQSG